MVDKDSEGENKTYMTKEVKELLAWERAKYRPK
jgi:hypothetical protein